MNGFTQPTYGTSISTAVISAQWLLQKNNTYVLTYNSIKNKLQERIQK
jgi:hypothetical protein